MRFAIRRTSERNEDVQPCANAYPGTRESWDVRTTESFDAYERKFGESFFDRGSEHQLRSGGDGIKRRLDDEKCWLIDVGSLEDLIALSEHYGELVLSALDEAYPDPSIEIYDGWRE